MQPPAVSVRRIRRIAAWQLTCLGLAVALVWLCIVFGCPASLYDVPLTSAAWINAGFLTGGLLALGALAFAPVYRGRKTGPASPVTVCSYCRKVHASENDWVRFEIFFSDHSLANFSHGVCPDCGGKVMQAYRAGEQNAGAVEPLPFHD